MNYLDKDVEAILDCLYIVGHRNHSGELIKQYQSLFYMYAILKRTKGLNTTIEDVHDVWTAWVLLENPFPKADPPVVVPFEEASEETLLLHGYYWRAIQMASAGEEPIPHVLQLELENFGVGQLPSKKSVQGLEYYELIKCDNDGEVKKYSLTDKGKQTLDEIKNQRQYYPKGNQHE